MGWVFGRVLGDGRAQVGIQQREGCESSAEARDGSGRPQRRAQRQEAEGGAQRGLQRGGGDVADRVDHLAPVGDGGVGVAPSVHGLELGAH